jgi:predicted Zn finger-like uncharacterized protein
MKFVCDRCQTKYSIADDKVRGKVLKVRCKTCQNVITVREVGARPSHGALAPVRPSQRPSSSAGLATLGEAHEELSERTSIAPAPAGLMADLIHGRRATPPPPPPLGDGIEWFLALEGAQQGPFPRKLLVDRLLALPKGADVHVWNEGMDGWKPPAAVPDVAADLAARRPPAVPTRPPVPRASPPLPPTAARRGTQPLSSGVGSKMPLPAPHVAAAHAHAVPAPHGGADEAAMPTPPPLAAHGAGHVAHLPGHAPGHTTKTNGVAAHASSPGIAIVSGESDALSALNLGARAAAPAAPRIMEVGEATAWSGAGRVQEGRHRNTKLVFALLGVVCVIIVVVVLNMTKKPPVAAPTTTAVKGGLDSESLAKLHDIVIEGGKPMAPMGGAVAPEEPAAGPAPETSRGKPTHGHPAPHGRPQHGATGAAVAASAGGTATTAAPSAPASGGGFRERSVTPVSAVANRPPPSQADITRVIANNKLGIKTCYQRALLRDSNLTHGKIVVGVTIGISGRVKGVHVDGPSSFRSLEPCIKEMVGRWTFPQSSDEYGTEFSYLFQGNE